MGSCDIVLEMHRTGELAEALGWAQARAPYEPIFGGRRSSDPCAFLRSRGE